MKNKIKIGLCGADGYVGAALLTLISSHPYLKLAGVFARNPESSDKIGVPVYPMDQLAEKENELDVLLLAVPPGASIEIITLLKDTPLKIIDLSGAFRLSRDELHAWYGISHDIPSLLTGAPYGLSPFASECLEHQKVVANPGCYATCALMSLIPLLQQGIVRNDNMIIDAKSGVSGAGKKSNPDLMFCEMRENFFPYKVGTHQHTPEINNALFSYTHQSCQITLVTHMLPVMRGISMSIYTDVNAGFDSEKEVFAAIEAAYQSAYRDYPFVKWGEINRGNVEQDHYLLSLKNVVNTPNTHIAYCVDGGKIRIFSCIDNLLKGAASQAIENINTLYHWPVETGLQKGEGFS